MSNVESQRSTGRNKVVGDWKAGVRAFIVESGTGENITSEQYYQKIITELAEMARVLEMDPEVLYREVTGD